jgi:uncharacterized protein YndB with AHSA1/START domain
VPEVRCGNVVGSSLAAALCCAVSAATAEDRVLRAEMEIAAPVEEVWRAWTSEEGVKTFFAPGARLEPRVDGAYEIFFNPTAQPGQRGAEGMRVLAFDPPRRLAFTWNAPPTIPAIRGQRTMVVVELAPVAGAPARTRLRFTHLGWGEGAEWDQAYAYFDHAWGGVVLPRLRHRFEKGPIDWSAPPRDLPAVAKSLRLALHPAP